MKAVAALLLLVLPLKSALYYLLLKAWGALFGGSDAAARSLSLVLGCVAVAGV